jgi:hypothetical protein
MILMRGYRWQTIAVSYSHTFRSTRAEIIIRRKSDKAQLDAKRRVTFCTLTKRELKNSSILKGLAHIFHELSADIVFERIQSLSKKEFALGVRLRRTRMSEDTMSADLR